MGSVAENAAKDKYSAVWVSHSSIGDFLKCPRAYYLKNIYKDPETRHKIALMIPPLALGQAVHEVVEALSIRPVDQRFDRPLMERFDQAWEKITGKRGGFADLDVEAKYKDRGREMVRRMTDHPGPLANLAVKIKEDLPYFWLSPDDDIILCGKIDWLEYLQDTDGVHIVDFKTGKREEKDGSLQLPIYYLLASNCQQRPITKVSYWYLGQRDTLTEQTLPDPEEAHQQVLEIAKQIKLARQLGRFKCPQDDGCYACRPLEAILNGEAELVGTDDYKRDVYILTQPATESDEERSVVL